MHPCHRLHPLQLLHRPQDALSHRGAIKVALIEHGIRPHGDMDRRVGAVLLHEHLGGAVDVEVGDHAAMRARSQAKKKLRWSGAPVRRPWAAKRNATIFLHRVAGSWPSPGYALANRPGNHRNSGWYRESNCAALSAWHAPMGLGAHFLVRYCCNLGGVCLGVCWSNSGQVGKTGASKMVSKVAAARKWLASVL